MSESNKRLSGWRALVTGASSGIGAAIAAELAGLGANLVLTARREDRLEAIAADLRQKHGIDVRVVAADLAQPDAAKTLFDRTEGEGLPIDILVNNAGFGAWKKFVETSWETAATILQVNVTSVTRLAHLFVPKMVERRRGHVMNVSSIAAYSPCPAFVVYGPTKSYVRDFSEGLDYELRGTGVRSICICPGGTTTEFSQVAGQKIRPGTQMMFMTAERCAQISIRKMLAGRRTVITGVMNVIGMWLLRFVPRAWMPWFAERTMATTVHLPGRS